MRIFYPTFGPKKGLFDCFVRIVDSENSFPTLLHPASQQGGAVRCKPGRRSRGALEASWGWSRGVFPRKGWKGRVSLVD